MVNSVAGYAYMSDLSPASESTVVDGSSISLKCQPGYQTKAKATTVSVKCTTGALAVDPTTEAGGCAYCITSFFFVQSLRFMDTFPY